MPQGRTKCRVVFNEFFLSPKNSFRFVIDLADLNGELGPIFKVPCNKIVSDIWHLIHWRQFCASLHAGRHIPCIQEIGTYSFEKSQGSKLLYSCYDRLCCSHLKFWCMSLSLFSYGFPTRHLENATSGA